MITINKPTIRLDAEYATLENIIDIDGERFLLWFRVDKKFKDYLCYELGDAYLVAALHYAMAKGHDINVIPPVTEQLLYNITTYLVPALTFANKMWHKPKIEAEILKGGIFGSKAVGTGISCGVDSFNSIAAHTASKFSGYNITHLAFNNVGSHGTGKKAEKLYLERMQRARSFAYEYGFELVVNESNLNEVFPEDFVKVHTYMNAFPILCLQKLYSVFFYSSAGYGFDEFSLKETSLSCSGTYELLSLPCFSTPNVRIYSDGMGMSRLDKVRNIVKYRPSYGYLNVCFFDDINCCKCEKCIRTILELECVGALDLYSSVFDVDYFRKHRKWYMQRMCDFRAIGKHDYRDLYLHFKCEVTGFMLFKSQVYRKVMALQKSHPRFFDFLLKIKSAKNAKT